MEKLILTTKPKRNYQFVQFLLDLFSLFLLYLHISVTISSIAAIAEFNRKMIANGAEFIKINPYPIIIWAAIALLVFITGMILPLIFKTKTKMNQKQFDMWVYAVMLIRLLVLIVLFDFHEKHLEFIVQQSKNLFSFSVIATIILTVIIIKFTQIRIKAAKPKQQETKKRVITED